LQAVQYKVEDELLFVLSIPLSCGEFGLTAASNGREAADLGKSMCLRLSIGKNTEAL
jgi:hypothetical protein